MKYGIDVALGEKNSANNIRSWGDFGLVSNQASLNGAFQPTWKLLLEAAPQRFKSLFGPQHGFEATVQDNMIETRHGIHQPTGKPLYSLYSETREPTYDMISNLDTLVIDLQLTGCRVYTFKATVAACLRAARKYGLQVVVLDRPNPLGGCYVEGAVLEPEAISFVGEYPLPLRHGLTTGEAARFFNRYIGADLKVVPLEGWDPHQAGVGQPWVITSPNLPTLDSVLVYPGMVLFEGTNISEGRGTTLPFQLLGSPHIKNLGQSEKLIEKIKEFAGFYATEENGVLLRPASFMPQFQKHAGKTCHGVHVMLLGQEHMPASRTQSIPLALACIKAFMEVLGADFSFRAPPYEYEEEKLPIEILFGQRSVDQAFSSTSFNIEDALWQKGVPKYLEKIPSALLYPRIMSHLPSKTSGFNHLINEQPIDEGQPTFEIQPGFSEEAGHDPWPQL